MIKTLKTTRHGMSDDLYHPEAGQVYRYHAGGKYLGQSIRLVSEFDRHDGVYWYCEYLEHVDPSVTNAVFIADEDIRRGCHTGHAMLELVETPEVKVKRG